MPTYALVNGQKVHTNLAIGFVSKKTEKEIRSVECVSGMSRCPPPPLSVEPSPMEVLLNVYDLIETPKNNKLARIGMGLFHSAVEVLGVEWSFGESDDGPEASGVFGVIPTDSCLAPQLRKKIRLGTTTLTSTQITWILRCLEREWPSKKYHILHCNCNAFAVEFAKRLQTTQPLVVPAWVNRIAKWADKLIPQALATWAVRKFDNTAQDNVPKAASEPPGHTTSHAADGGVIICRSGGGSVGPAPEEESSICPSTDSTPCAPKYSSDTEVSVDDIKLDLSLDMSRREDKDAKDNTTNAETDRTMTPPTSQLSPCAAALSPHNGPSEICVNPLQEVPRGVGAGEAGVPSHNEEVCDSKVSRGERDAELDSVYSGDERAL